MNINKLDHVNVRTTRLDEMIEWYSSVLGMHSGNRPNLPFPGAWMYAGDTAVIHLVEVDTTGAGAEQALKLEHFAFSATNLKDFILHLERSNTPFKQKGPNNFKLIQVNLWDPDGNHIHVDFHSNE